MKAELDYIENFDSVYPGITLWYKSKVIDSQDKKLWIAKHNCSIAGLAIIDLSQAKLCHFSIGAQYRFTDYKTPIKDYLYKCAIQEFKSEGILEIFAHGTESIVNQFIKSFKGWEMYQDIGNFGRGEKDVIIKNKI